MKRNHIKKLLPLLVLTMTTSAYAIEDNGVSVGVGETSTVLQGTHIITNTDGVHGLHAEGLGAEITVESGVSIVTSGTDAYAVYAANNSHITLNSDTTIESDNAYALYAENKALISGCGKINISSNRDDNSALYVVNGGKVNLTLNQASLLDGNVHTEIGGQTDLIFMDNSTFSGTSYTEGGQTNLTFVNYSTLGSGMYTNGGQIDATFMDHSTLEGDVNTEGGQTNLTFVNYSTLSGGMYTNGGQIDATFVDHSTLEDDVKTTGGQTNLTFVNHSTLNGMIFALSGKVNLIFKNNSTLGNDVYTYREQTNLTFLNNSIFDGDILTNEGQTDANFMKNSIFDGNIKTTDGQTNATFVANSIFEGSVRTDSDFGAKTNLTFEDNSLWKLIDDSNVTMLTNTNSVIDMTQDGNILSTLTVNTLSGKNGTIMMDIDADTKTGDAIVVNGAFNNTHYLDLYNRTTHDPIGKEGIGTYLATTTNTGGGTFVGKDREEALYWIHYILGTDVTRDTTNWFLKDITKIYDHTTSIDVIMSAVNYHTWRNENDKLMKRMGELRLDGSKTGGVWARIEGNKIGRSGDYGFENKYKTYEIGYDKLIRNNENHTRYVGAAFTYTDGTSTYDRGNGDNNSKSLSLYATDIGSKGHYLDLVFKVSSMDNDFKVYDTNSQKITGDYTNRGISFSAEYGRKSELKHGWYIEPQGQLTIGRLRGDDYTTSNDIHVAQDSINSFVVRAGFNIGKQIGTKGVVYAKANVLHEFGGGYDVSMRAGSDRLSKSDDFDDTWFEYGIGAAFRTSSDSSIYMDLERSTGSDYKKDWQWNIGARWMF